MKGPTKRRVLLALLERNIAAQYMIATWPNAYRQGMRRKDLIRRWAHMTGLREIEVENAWPLVFDNGFCLAAGEVDPVADAMVETILAGKIKVRRPARRGDGNSHGTRDAH